MLQRFANVNIPLGIALPILLCVAAGSVAVGFGFREEPANYRVLLPNGTSGQSEFAYGAWPELASQDFFRTVRDRFVSERANFIEADLTEKQLTVYADGAAQFSVPILAIGKEGSWWETPAGLYRIESKEKNHYSGFTGVHMPWSLPFQGNFFIHGWPYYPDGTPVESTYSGGCVRLSTDDALRVYDAVAVGTPVLVFRKIGQSDPVRFGVAPPIVSAKQYLVADIGSSFVFAERDPAAVVPVASITKFMTALVAAEYINLDKSITVTKEMLVATSKPRLWVGQRVRAFDLMYPLLLESSNEAAQVYAHALGPERFVRLMNEKARALGLSHTTFVDTSGAGAGNISSAADLFQLQKYLRENQSFYLGVTTGRATRQLGVSPIFGGLENFNGFGGSAAFLGGKIGVSTAAGETMASLFAIEEVAVGRPVAIIVLGSKNAIGDTAALVEYVKRTFTVTE